MKICIKGNEFNPSFISLYGEQKAIEQGYTIYEVPLDYVDCAFEDFDSNGFNIELYNHRKHLETIPQQIAQLKAELNKYKEDVEQVELFDMERADYEQKKARCAEIIIELRKLEREVRDVNL